MPQTDTTITLEAVRGKGYAYGIHIPYDNSARLAFRSLFEDKRDRSWNKETKLWLFHAKHLDQVRAFAQEQASQHDWKLLDFLAMSPQEAKAAREQLFAERRARAQEWKGTWTELFLNIFPSLLNHKVTLSACYPGFLVLNVQGYLGEIYGEVMRLKRSQPRFEFPQGYDLFYVYDQKLSINFQIPAASLSSLLLFASMLSKTIHGLENRQDLDLVTEYQDGVCHFQDEQGALWIGAPYEQALKRPYHLCGNTHEQAIHLKDREIYLIKEASTFITTTCTKFALQQFNGKQEDAELWRLLDRYHLSTWGSQWICEQLQEKEISVKHDTPVFTRWQSVDNWPHVADAILLYLVSAVGYTTLLKLNLQKADLIRLQEKIAEQKQAARQKNLEYCYAHAHELAEEVLVAKENRDMLRGRAEAFGIAYKKSWSKSQLAQAILQNPASFRLACTTLRLPLFEKEAHVFQVSIPEEVVARLSVLPAHKGEKTYG